MPIANGITLPNSLSNGTTADAVPVMANYNALLNALNRALLDGGGTAGMNAQSTVIHNLSPGVAGTDAINLNQLNNSVAGYLPLTGGTLTGGLAGTTLSLSSTLSVTGASTVAALTASGVITGNAGFSGTTLNLSGNAGITGNVNVTGTSALGNSVSITSPTLGVTALTINGSSTSGPYVSGILILNDVNNTQGAVLQLKGNGATTPAKYIRVSGGVLNVVNNAFNSNILTLDDSGNLSVVGGLSSTTLIASGLITGNAGFSGTTLVLSGVASLNGGGTSTTPALGDNSTSIATTAFVQSTRATVVQSVASAATVTPTFSNDLVDITAQAAALNLANPTGTAFNGAGMVIRIKDNGTARAITYGTQYVGIGLGLPATTVAGKVLVLGMIYNSNLTRWEVVSQAQE